MNDTDAYKLRWRGRETGPFSLEEINRRLDEHEIGMGHEIQHQGQWITVEEFFVALEPKPEPIPEPPPVLKKMPVRAPLPEPPPIKTPPIRVRVTRGDATEAPSGPLPPKRRMIFAVLAIVAGFAGAHNFYARQWLTGLLQLLLSVATYLMGFGIVASWLWAMAEAVFVRNDGEGIEMT